jgi:hypothetical protein
MNIIIPLFNIQLRSIDRYHPPAIPSTERFRHLSLKNQEMQKPFVRGGELPLPSRAQHNTSLAPLNINIRPPLNSHSSSDSSKRGNNYTTLNLSRSRSGSLRTYVANSLPRMTTNSQSSSSVSDILVEHGLCFNQNFQQQSSLSLGRPIVIAVIGTSSSGKSTVIRKGLSGFGVLTDPTLVSGPTHASNLPRC